MVAGLASSLLRRLRLALLALFLVCGQAAMLAHAADHAGDGVDLPHVCLLCIAGQNLDGPAPTAFPPPPLPAALGDFAPPPFAVPAFAGVFLAGARARAPPAA